MASPIRFSLFHRIWLSLLLVSLVPILAIWLLGRQTMLNQAQAAVEDQLRGVSARIKSEIDGWSEADVQTLRLAAATPAMVSLDPKQQKPVLEAALKEIPESYLVHTVGADGKNIARSDAEAPKDYSQRKYFKDAFANVPLSHDVVIGSTSKKPSWVVGVPVVDNGKPVAALVLAINLNKIAKIIEASRFGHTGFGFLMQDDGKLVASPDVPMGDKLIDFNTNPAYVAFKRGDANPLHFSENGKDKIAYVQRTAIGWVNIVQQDLDEGMEPVRRADRFALILLVLTLLLVSLIAYYVARGVSKPILSLTDVADQISRGKLNHELLEKSRSDEIGALARAIDRMAKSMTIALQKLRK